MSSISAKQIAPQRPVEFDDGRSYDPIAVQRIEKLWVEKQMKDRESEFTGVASVKIFCGTWNVNAKKNEDESLNEWLNKKNQDYDLYIVGFQEIVDLSAVNVAVDSKSQKQSQYWQKQIEDVIGMQYKQIAAKHLVGVLLCIYVKESLQHYLKDVRCTTAGVGVMGMMGNKGGVSVHFYFYDSAICVVSAHLAAHRENVAGRNADFQNIIEKSIFTSDTVVMPLQPEEIRRITGLRSVGLLPPDASELSIIQHDIVFWIGDLNYRIDESVSLDDVFNKINEGDLNFLNERDQLNIERLQHRVFQGFSEGQLNFLPTYKYQAGTDSYDRRPEKKVRAPAWCDRILWKVLDGSRFESIKQTSYTRSELKSSDHKPVSASFECNLRRIIGHQQTAVFQESMKLLDKYSNESIPRVELEGEVVQLGTVHYQIPVVNIVRVKNINKDVRANWRFIPKVADTSIGRPWVTVVDITIKVTVDATTAHLLNSGCELLEDILVLRIENGVEHYITLNGTYARSCYGMSLMELMCTLQPVRNTPSPEARKTSSDKLSRSISTTQPDLSIPKEIWRLVDALYRDGMQTADLFIAEGDNHQ
eukprot:gene11585-24229_t